VNQAKYHTDNHFLGYVRLTGEEGEEHAEDEHDDCVESNIPHRTRENQAKFAFGENVSPQSEKKKRLGGKQGEG